MPNFDFYEKTLINTIPRKKPSMNHHAFLNPFDEENHMVSKMKVKNKSVNIDIGIMMGMYKKAQEEEQPKVKKLVRERKQKKDNK